jgi:hypothetical protein
MRSRKGEQIQRSMGGGQYEGRDPHGFWPTPQDCTVALIRFLRRHEPEALQYAREWGVLEPACGDGAMARPIESMGFRVAAFDLIGRGYGIGGVDFLETAEPDQRVIITNPSYSKGVPEAFILHASGMPRVTLTALLLPIGFCRVPLYEHWTPAWLLPLTWRPDFTGGGSSPMRLQWVVWSRSSHSSGQGRTLLLERPEYARGAGLW